MCMPMSCAPSCESRVGDLCYLTKLDILHTCASEAGGSDWDRLGQPFRKESHSVRCLSVCLCLCLCLCLVCVCISVFCACVCTSAVRCTRVQRGVASVCGGGVHVSMCVWYGHVQHSTSTHPHSHVVSPRHTRHATSATTATHTRYATRNTHQHRPTRARAEAGACSLRMNRHMRCSRLTCVCVCLCRLYRHVA